MARPNKSGLDYFPLDVHVDDKIELIEAKHGLIGFGVVVKLFQNIYKNGYFINVSEDRLLLLSKHIGVDNNQLIDIINDGIKWGLFDQDSFEKHSILTSRGVQKRYIEATKRRKEVEFIEEYLLVEDVKNMYHEKVSVRILGVNVCNNSKKENNNSQSKVKKSKEKNTPHTPQGVDDRFDKFWDMYSKKKDRAKCMRKWKKIKESDKDKIFSSLPAYIASTPDIQFRKNPLTYLNGECWNDDVAPDKDNVIPMPTTREFKSIEQRKAEEIEIFGQLVTDWDEIERSMQK